MIRFSPKPNRSHLISWHEWGEDAFRKAKEQDKPVMLFLTAFWCGFCQRMDEGAFSAKENMALLNAYFIPVRAENAQRPDVDVRYNQNGWPMIVFMTAEGILLTVANYLESEPFADLLVRVYSVYHEKKRELESLGEKTLVAEQTSRTGASELNVSALHAITEQIMHLADGVNGGYGSGQKFIYPEANDFLLSRFAATEESRYLDHVCLTLEQMRDSQIHDHESGGYFRTTSGADWSHPHREKLLAEQAGLLLNCLRTFEITQRRIYAHMAEGILDYLDTRLSDACTGAFYGCEDFVRGGTGPSGEEEFFAIRDENIYADANARAFIAYLRAAMVLGRPERRDRALQGVEFLWHHCRRAEEGMFHYFDGVAHVPGLLNDQTYMGAALVLAYQAMGDDKYLHWATELAEFILAKLYNPRGGFWDLSVRGPALLSYPVTLIDQNGATASFFIGLSTANTENRYRDAALWALNAYRCDFSSYGISAALYGQALGQFIEHR